MDYQLKDFYPALDLFLQLKNKPSIWYRHPKVGADDVSSFIVNYVLVLMHYKTQSRRSHPRIFLTPSIDEYIDRNIIDASLCYQIINNLHKLGLCK